MLLVIKCFIFSDKCSPGNKYICKNGGTCVISRKGDATCVCGDEYEGSTCERGKCICPIFIFFRQFLIGLVWLTRKILWTI